MISSTVIMDKDLTVHECHGAITQNAILDSIRQFYIGDPTMNVIWDMTDCDCSGISTSQVAALSAEVKKVAHSRVGGRTAIASPGDLCYGMSRMYQVIAETDHHVSEIRAFRRFEEAEH